MHTRLSPWRFGFALTAGALFAACDGNRNDNRSPGDTFAITSDNRLVSFDRELRSVRTAAAIGNLQSGEQIVGIDIRPASANGQTLYGLSSAGRLYTLEPGTGAATLVATLAADPADTTSPFAGLSGSAFGVDFNPVVDRLRVVSDTGQNLRINVDTGATTTDGALVADGAVLNDVSATAYSNAFAAACRTTHFFIDTANDRLLSAISSNDGTLAAIGALGIDADVVNGFDVLTQADGSNTLIAALTVGGEQRLYALSGTTGIASDEGRVTGLDSGETIRGLAVATVTVPVAQAPGELLGLTVDDQLVSFNAAAPQKLCTSGVTVDAPGSEILQGIDLRPETGEVIALATDGSTGRLYAMDPANGALSLKSTLSEAVAGASFGLDFNPTVDRLRIVSDSGQNLRINVDTGAATIDGRLNGGSSGATAAAYTNSVGGLTAAAPGVFTTDLFVIDPASDTVYRQSPPNDGTLVEVGELGVDADAVAAFDINARTGAAVAALNSAAAATSDLYAINLATGAATRVNAVGGGKKLKALSYRVNAKADLLALTTDNRLTRVPAGSPAEAAAPVAIAGLGAGETLVGLDYRPATGQIVAASDASKLYTLSFDGAAATASPLSSLSEALSGLSFGLDFNPVPDRLRMVSDTEQNLRINVSSGAVTVDGTLAPAIQVIGAAYTKNFSGTTATQLYYLDVGSDTLQTTAAPNDGTLTPVGSFGTAVGAEGDLDIFGGQDGIVFAALNPEGTAGSQLYRVNLATGALTTVGVIGDGSYLLRGLTVRVQ